MQHTTVTNIILEIEDIMEPYGRNCNRHTDRIQTEVLEHQPNQGRKFKNTSALVEGLCFVVQYNSTYLQ
jgi:hypothetical protein